MPRTGTGAPGIGVVVYDIDAVGGMERQALRLVERLAARNLRVTVFSPHRATSVALPGRERRPGVEIIRVPLVEDRLSIAEWWRYFEDLMAAALAARPWIDVLYAVHYAAAYHAVRVGRLVGLPVVMKFACSGEHGDIATLRRRDQAADFERALRCVSRFACITEAVRDEAHAFGLDPARTVLIPNGIDLAAWGRARGPTVGAGGQILFVGRLAEQKAVDVLLRAFARVRVAHPRARLLCAGDGPERASLEALTDSLGLAGSVDFLGRRDDVHDLLREAAVFVLPSRSEGLSNSLLEALATGTPVIASDIPGTREVVRHEVDGLLVPVDDAAALAAAIDRVLGDSSLAARLSSSGRARALEFDLERVADAYLNLFADLARGRRAGAFGSRASARRNLLRRVLRLARLLSAEEATTARLCASRLLGQSRRAISDRVVAAKARVGVEGPILRRLLGRGHRRRPNPGGQPQ